MTGWCVQRFLAAEPSVGPDLAGNSDHWEHRVFPGPSSAPPWFATWCRPSAEDRGSRRRPGWLARRLRLPAPASPGDMRPPGRPAAASRNARCRSWRDRCAARNVGRTWSCPCSAAAASCARGAPMTLVLLMHHGPRLVYAASWSDRRRGNLGRPDRRRPAARPAGSFNRLFGLVRALHRRVQLGSI